MFNSLYCATGHFCILAFIIIIIGWNPANTGLWRDQHCFNSND